MTKEYSLKLFVILLWIGIFLTSPLFLSNKAFAQVCSFGGYSPTITPDPELCTDFFFRIDERSSNPPCNSSPVCDNKEYIPETCKRIGIGGVDATTCCKQRFGPNYFCDQKDLGSEIILRYQFRCCNVPPTPTPTPVPSCSSYTNCSTCISGAPFDCGWKNGSVCQSGTSSCPQGTTTWNFFSCTQNLCQAPTPTPCPGCLPTLTPTPSPTPTPTPTPTCSSFGDCTSCTGQPSCGWGGVAVYSCREGTSSFCPTVNGQKYTRWSWDNCTQNTCPVPTPTPCPGCIPTPTLTPTPTRVPTPTPTTAPSCPAPTNLVGACNTTVNILNFTWTSNSACARYAIRIDDKANGWGGDTPLSGDTVDNNASAPYSRSVSVGPSYDWWVHGIKQDGVYTFGVNGARVTCAVPTPTPTAGPTPTSAPTPTAGPTPTPLPTSIPEPTPTPGGPQTYSIKGYAFIDTNQNGIKDSGESCYLGNVTVSLSGVGSRTYTQDPSCINLYSFINLAAGRYTVSFTSIPQYTLTTPSSVTVTVP